MAGERPGQTLQATALVREACLRLEKTDALVWGYNQTCSFGLMKFDTTLDDPQVVFECIDIDANLRHTHTLKGTQLRGGAP